MQHSVPSESIASGRQRLNTTATGLAYRFKHGIASHIGASGSRRAGGADTTSGLSSSSAVGSQLPTGASLRCQSSYTHTDSNEPPHHGTTDRCLFGDPVHLHPKVMSKPINSRAKGARGERHVASLLTSEGFPARRGVQCSQGNGVLSAPDVVCESLPELHIEVKFTQQVNLEKFFLQASRDAGSRIPAVFTKKNNSELFVITKFKDFISILRRSDLVASTADYKAAIESL